MGRGIVKERLDIERAHFDRIAAAKLAQTPICLWRTVSIAMPVHQSRLSLGRKRYSMSSGM